MIKFLKKLWEAVSFKNDPVFHCELYKKEGCNFVDGFLCDYPDCSMNNKYIKNLQDEEQNKRTESKTSKREPKL